MSIRKESLHESYDVIVVGSGMGGLTAGAGLAARGKHVLVVERHDRPGGYVHGFRRKKYHFDAGAHVVSAAEPVGVEGAFLDDVLRALGVRELVEFRALDPYYTAAFPDMRFTVPATVSGFTSAHSDCFPHERKGIRAFVRTCAKMTREERARPSGTSVLDLDPDRFPLHAALARATLQDVLDDHLTDGRAKAVLATWWPYLGVPPSRLAFTSWASMFTSQVHGIYYAVGGLQNLANAMVTALERHGSEFLPRSTVRRILIEDGQVRGVRLENGQRIAAPVVVSNADALQTFEELIGAEHLPAGHLDSLRTTEPSVSALMVYLATGLDLGAREGATPETFVFGSWDHDENYETLLAGRPEMFLISVPTLVDPTLAPEGEHLVILASLIAYDGGSWRQRKDPAAEALLASADLVVPGLAEAVTFMEVGSPRTMERYTLNRDGAVYGWAHLPPARGPRLGQTTPVEGLFLAGHWTTPGAGVVSVTVSGFQAAGLVLGDRRPAPLVLGDLLRATTATPAASPGT
jgi:phytoene desaturase